MLHTTCPHLTQMDFTCANPTRVEWQLTCQQNVKFCSCLILISNKLFFSLCSQQPPAPPCPVLGTLFAALGRLTGPVKKMLVATGDRWQWPKGTKCPKEQTQRTVLRTAKSQGEKELQERCSSSEPFHPVTLPFPIQQHGVFILQEAQSSGGPCIYEMDFFSTG